MEESESSGSTSQEQAARSEFNRLTEAGPNATLLELIFAGTYFQ